VVDADETPHQIQLRAPGDVLDHATKNSILRRVANEVGDPSVASEERAAAVDKLPQEAKVSQLIDTL